MAATTYQSQLRLVQRTGVDLSTGEPIYKTKSFSNIRTEATAEQLYRTAQAIASLQEWILVKVERRDDVEINQA